jgi:hypothetical protein
MTFDTDRIIEKFCAGELDEKALYWLLFREYFWEQQSEPNRLALELDVLERLKSPGQKSKLLSARAKKFHEQNEAIIQAGGAARKTRLQALIRADAIKATGKIKWRHTVVSLTVFAYIHLIVELKLSQTDSVGLRKIVDSWLCAHGRKATDPSSWSRCLHTAGIQELIGPSAKAKSVPLS